MPATPSPGQPIKLYRTALSGHCHRVELFLSLLGLPVEKVDVDMRSGAHKQPDFLAMNRFGQVPVMVDGDVMLADSNAILVYLEARYAPGRWLPRDPVGAAQVQRWLSVSAGQLAFGPATARVIALFKRPVSAQESVSRAQELFAVMEHELSQRAFLAGEQPTLADIANYSYTAHAPEGHVSLQAYPHVRAWLERIEALPGFVPMMKSPVGPVA